MMEIDYNNKIYIMYVHGIYFYNDAVKVTLSDLYKVHACAGKIITLQLLVEN